MIATPDKTAARILKETSLRPALGLVLGSGFNGAQNALRPAREIPYRMLPGFLPTQIDGHEGKLIIGCLGATPVLALCGRSHYYEGHSLGEITFPIRVLAACGIQVLLLTNAAGGINRKYRPGHFMCLTDHLNFMGENPLRGIVPGQTAPFVDLCHTYDPELNQLLGKAARQARIVLHQGVYVAVAGPCYETPAEIRAFRRLGADAVGMSTVPEAIVAKHCGLRVAALSCITNPAAGLNPHPISHTEVLAAGEQVKTQAAALLTGFSGLLT